MKALIFILSVSLTLIKSYAQPTVEGTINFLVNSQKTWKLNKITIASSTDSITPMPAIELQFKSDSTGLRFETTKGTNDTILTKTDLSFEYIIKIAQNEPVMTIKNSSSNNNV